MFPFGVPSTFMCYWNGNKKTSAAPYGVICSLEHKSCHALQLTLPAASLNTEGDWEEVLNKTSRISGGWGREWEELDVVQWFPKSLVLWHLLWSPMGISTNVFKWAGVHFCAHLIAFLTKHSDASLSIKNDLYHILSLPRQLGYNATHLGTFFNSCPWAGKDTEDGVESISTYLAATK